MRYEKNYKFAVVLVGQILQPYHGFCENSKRTANLENPRFNVVVRVERRCFNMFTGQVPRDVGCSGLRLCRLKNHERTKLIGLKKWVITGQMIYTKIINIKKINLDYVSTV